MVPSPTHISFAAEETLPLTQHDDAQLEKQKQAAEISQQTNMLPDELFDQVEATKRDLLEFLIEKKREKPHGHHHMEDIRDIYKTLPVNSTGHLEGTGDPKLDGDVKNALDLADRLSKSRRVKQSFIRHAFRYFMGRNEFLSDSKTLIDAEKAYDKSGGSFDAVPTPEPPSEGTPARLESDNDSGGDQHFGE